MALFNSYASLLEGNSGMTFLLVTFEMALKKSRAAAPTSQQGELFFFQKDPQKGCMPLFLWRVFEIPSIIQCLLRYH